MTPARGSAPRWRRAGGDRRYTHRHNDERREAAVYRLGKNRTRGSIVAALEGNAK